MVALLDIQNQGVDLNTSNLDLIKVVFGRVKEAYVNDVVRKYLEQK